MATLAKKYNLHVLGNPEATTTLVFAHGYGSDQTAWRFITPAFAADYRLVLFDMVGCGNSDLYAFDPLHYKSLHQYADDLIEICTALSLPAVHLIAHSVSSMIGTLAALKRPDLFASLVFLSASPRYLNDADSSYIGGFSQQQVGDLLIAMAQDYLDWLRGFAPYAVDAPDQPHLANEFADSLARMLPGTSLAIAKKIFFSDHRADVARLNVPVLIVQSATDVIVPHQVGEYLHQVIPNSQLRWIATTGHFPHMTNPHEIIQVMTEHLNHMHHGYNRADPEVT